MASFVLLSEETVIPPIGKVDLLDKSLPVCERENLADDSVWAFERAQANIDLLKDKIRKLPDSAWEDDGQSGNANIVRPSHDNWGIKKILFTFCDDFLLRVFDFPWSKDEEWRSLLVPIYDLLGVEESKVVRCLLASMGPGTSIPVHHDTGYWVKHTHRIHVPIETGPEVDFLVGPTNEKMRRYEFSEGAVIELNNQAKHAVANRMNRRRIHLIFDYVDSHPFKRISLQPGQKLNQTRRTIDLPSEAGSRQSPSFIVIGAQKSGTTSLYEYISQHPMVVKGKRRETHFFDWRWNDKLETHGQQHDYYMNFFERAALHKHPSLMTGESTPSYLLHSDLVIPRLKAVCPWAKILVILRDPVARAYSQYQMAVDPSGTPEQQHNRGMSSYKNSTFEQVIDKEINLLTSAGITADSPYELFREKVLSALPMRHGGHSIIARGLYCLQLIPWLEQISDSNLLILGTRDIQGDKRKVRAEMNRVFEFVGLPEHDIEDVAPKNTRDYSPVSQEAKERLKVFYEPFNRRLFEMLGHELNW